MHPRLPMAVPHHRIAGISGDERVVLRLWRTFPVWGIATWLLAEVVLMNVVSAGLALAFATGTCAAVGVLMMALAGFGVGWVVLRVHMIDRAWLRLCGRRRLGA